jgi:Xaa-Pro aminopeptidase
MATKTTDTFPILSLAERDRRWELTREFMRENDLEAILFAGPLSPLRYQHYLSNDNDAMLLLFPLESEPVYIGGWFQLFKRFDRKRAGFTPWIEDARFEPDPSLIARIIEERGLSKSRIGVTGLFGFHGLSVGGMAPFPLGAAVTGLLPEAELVDVSEPYGVMMLPKSDEEIALARQAASCCERACEAIVEVAHAGTIETELHAAAVKALAQGGSAILEPNLILTVGQGHMGFWETDWYFPDRSPRPLENGDVINAEVFAWYAGMHTQAQLCVVVGEPNEEQRHMGQIARQAYEAGVDAVRPGATFESVWQPMEEIILDAGYWAASPLVHTLTPTVMVGPLFKGLAERDDIDPEVRMPAMPAWGDIVIEEGTLFAIEPMVGSGYQRLMVGGTVLTTADGSEELNSLSTNLQVG